jgi:hypothetical protein
MQDPNYHDPNEGAGFADMFAGQDVDGPGAGQWGASGTAASATNQAQVASGAQALQRGQQQGEAANARGQYNSGQALQVAQQAQNRTAPQANWNPSNQTLAGGQSALAGAQNTVNALNNFAAHQGQGPSAAQAAGQQQINQGLGQQLAMARSGRGFGSNAAAMGQAQSGMAQVTANAQNAAMQQASAEDQANKQRQLAALNASLGGGLGVASGATQLANQQGQQTQFDVNSALQNRGMNDAYSTANNQNALGWAQYGTGAQQGYEGMGNQYNIAHQQLGQNAFNSQADYELGQQQMELEAQKANQATDTERDAANTSTLGSVVSMLAMSDERTKKLKRQESALSDALGTLGEAPGYSYKYKNPDQPGAAHGTQVSSMAQDLERGPLGERIVMNTPQGKMVDYSEVVKMTPGAITELNHKLKALESALGKAA